MNTTSANDFLEANKSSPVVYAEWMTPDNKEIKTKDDVLASDRCLYRLENGKRFLVLASDLKKTKVSPKWHEGKK